jgi:hypothetical protein
MPEPLIVHSQFMLEVYVPLPSEIDPEEAVSACVPLQRAAEPKGVAAGGV